MVAGDAQRIFGIAIVRLQIVVRDRPVDATLIAFCEFEIVRNKARAVAAPDMGGAADESRILALEHLRTRLLKIERCGPWLVEILHVRAVRKTLVVVVDLGVRTNWRSSLLRQFRKNFYELVAIRFLDAFLTRVQQEDFGPFFSGQLPGDQRAGDAGANDDSVVGVGWLVVSSDEFRRVPDGNDFL